MTIHGLADFDVESSLRVSPEPHSAQTLVYRHDARLIGGQDLV